MKKLLMIPRALMDVISISRRDITMAEKSSLTYSFLFLKFKKWIYSGDAIITFPLFGIKIHCCNNQSVQHLLKEIFLEKVYDLSHVFKHAEALHFIDAGANIGLSALFLKRNFKNATVNCYEPAQTSFDLLKKNVENEQGRGITIEQVAVSNKDGKLYAEMGFGPCSENQTFAEHGQEVNAVKCVRLVHLLQRQKWDCVKLDIEGAEVNVLMDVIEQGQLNKSTSWLIEFHKEDDKKELILKEFMKERFLFTQKKGVYCFVQYQRSLRDN